MLLEKGANIDLVYSDSGQEGTALFTSWRINGSRSRSEYSILYIYIGMSPLDIMASKGCWEAASNAVVNVLLAFGADVNASVDGDGTTPLHYAQAKRVVVCSRVDAGAD